LELLEFCFTLSKAQKIAQMKFEKYEWDIKRMIK
jgi:hypothetical protein